ncbi:hypothetical protein OS175_03190 [Marinicella sp. S1101]|uniref:hypothetical protein n=1 Tax=Marinicella marina TaxID=2996016 RepID=UPI0022608456|nr:hypothetical protein [Marinicella marina]MCX7552873.1 hypothetical protein [Marinicella marina]MDJ1139818.1 hypothetical protein [Marinicella marina]
MSNDREKLKALLLNEEIAQIKALQKLLNDKQALTEKISEVIDPATDLAIAKNPKFQKKFSKIDSKAYVRAIKANKQTFIDALLPIIGPMIRKSVTSAIRRFVSDVNRAVEMGFSIQALKWRWKAFRTGVPFAEIVFNNTIEYQVQQVFLIDNNSGLLIAYAGHEEYLLQDKDAMSAMLTAIQDFVKDSVNSGGSGLAAAEIDDDILWITAGNKAQIAAIIKGAPTQRLRERMLAASEDIHIEFYQELDSQELWENNHELESELEKLLLTKSQSDDEESPKGINYWPWVMVIAGLLLWWGWSTYQQHQTEQKLLDSLRNTPGFVLTNLSHSNGQYTVEGLQDPMAEIAPQDVELTINSTPFISLEDPILRKRAEQILSDDSLHVEVNNGVMIITGEHNNDEAYKQKLLQLKSQPGINSVDDRVSHQPKADLAGFLQQNSLPPSIKATENAGIIELSGYATKSMLDELTAELKKYGGIDAQKVELVVLDEIKQSIKQTPLIMTNPAALNQPQQNQLNALIEQFQKLINLQPGVGIMLIGKSDCQGSAKQSNKFSQMRVNTVSAYLSENGLKAATLRPKISACENSNSVIDARKIGVWFEVVQ